MKWRSVFWFALFTALVIAGCEREAEQPPKADEPTRTEQPDKAEERPWEALTRQEAIFLAYLEAKRLIAKEFNIDPAQIRVVPKILKTFKAQPDARALSAGLQFQLFDAYEDDNTWSVEYFIWRVYDLPVKIGDFFYVDLNKHPGKTRFSWGKKAQPAREALPAGRQALSKKIEPPISEPRGEAVLGLAQMKGKSVLSEESGLAPDHFYALPPIFERREYGGPPYGGPPRLVYVYFELSEAYEDENTWSFEFLVRKATHKSVNRWKGEFFYVDVNKRPAEGKLFWGEKAPPVTEALTKKKALLLARAKAKEVILAKEGPFKPKDYKFVGASDSWRTGFWSFTFRVKGEDLKVSPEHWAHDWPIYFEVRVKKETGETEVWWEH